MRLKTLKYDIRKFFNSKYFWLFLLLSSYISFKAVSDFKNLEYRHVNVIEGIINNLISPSTIMFFLIPVCLYYINTIFFDDYLNNYIKIRYQKKSEWYKDRCISLLFYNIITIGIFFIETVISSFIYLPKGIQWSQMNLNVIKSGERISIFPFEGLFSPITSVILILIFLILGITLLGTLSSTISLIFYNPKIGTIFIYFYFFISTKTDFFITKSNAYIKYAFIDGYILFARHNFSEDTFALLTVRESLIYLFLLLILSSIIGSKIVKNIDFSKREELDEL